MPVINHTLLVEVLDILRYDICLFDKDRTCSNSFLYIPMGSSILRRWRSWIVIGKIKFISIITSPVRVYVFCLKFPIKGEPKSTNCGIEIVLDIDFVGAFDFTILCKKRCRYIFGHVEVTSINDCIDHVLLLCCILHWCFWEVT